MKLRSAPWITAGITAILLVGCSTAPSESDEGEVSLDPPSPAPSVGDVIGEGTVVQKEGDPALLCLGDVAESLPPQCSGPEITNWDWSTIKKGHETADDITWGSYTVQGTWDGTALTVTEPPVVLAPHDPTTTAEPFRDPENAGKSNRTTLERADAALTDSPTVQPLETYIVNGYLFVTVPHDSGPLQEYADRTYGKDTVIIRSALSPVEP